MLPAVDQKEKKNFQEVNEIHRLQLPKRKKLP